MICLFIGASIKDLSFIHAFFNTTAPGKTNGFIIKAKKTPYEQRNGKN